MLVTRPNNPGNGVSRRKLNAWRQSTCPPTIGPSNERNASSADALAMGIASRPAQFTPSRFTQVNSRMIAMAMAGTGTDGSAHWWIAEPESRAVRPHVGTQPHQYETPVRFPSTGAYGRNASPQVAAMPPTRSGHINTSSVQPGNAIHASTSPTINSGIAAVPCPRIAPSPLINAPIRNRL